MNVKITKAQKIRILYAHDVYSIMQQVLLRENKIDRGKEHFWTVGMDRANHIVYVELISIGTSHSTQVEPMQVFRIAIQKAALKIILVHNHPSGQLRPSDEDLILTDRLIQVGRIVGIEVYDHLIITENSYISLEDRGEMKKLRSSNMYAPNYKQIQQVSNEAKEIGEQQGKEKTKKEIVLAMKMKKYSVEQIMELTGLTKIEIGRIRMPKPKPTKK
jgi:DNA repair protein RadC